MASKNKIGRCERMGFPVRRADSMKWNMNQETKKLDRPLLEMIRGGALPPAGSRVVVGVSGGKDSVVLLDALATLAEEFSWSLIVAHLDHSLRDESVADATWVGAMAEHLRLESILQRVDVAAMAAEFGEGVEHAAREARLRFFVDAAQEFDATAVVVAHHAGDQAETVLFRMARGTSVRGLAGMAPRRELADGVTLFRPMLTATREAIDTYAAARGLAWREDASNTDPTFRRNAIRHEILPRLVEQVAPGAESALVRLATQAAEVSEFLAATARALLAEATVLQRPDRVILDVKCMLAGEAVVRREAVRQVLETMGMGLRDLSDRHLRDVDGLLAAKRGTVNLPERFLAKREAALILLLSAEATASE